MKAQYSAILKPIQNSRGIMTAEFIFSITLCAGLCVLLFALNFSLSMAEVAQYIAFSAARAHAAGHVDQEKQEQLAKDKFAELTNHKVLKTFFTPAGANWFKLSALDVRGGGVSQKSFDDFYPAYSNGDQRIPQVGVRFSFSPALLNIKIAFLGSTAEDPDQGFSANISGLLIREPTQKECWELQVKRRYSAILDLDQRFKELGSSGANKYVPMEDNGC